MDELDYFFGDVAKVVAKVSGALVKDARIPDVTTVAEGAGDGVGWARLRLPGPLRHPSGALVGAVPVLPVARRPRVRESDPAKLVLALGPINLAYRTLARQVARWTQLVALGVPDTILANEQRIAAGLLAQLCGAVHGASRAHWLHRSSNVPVISAMTSIAPPRPDDAARSRGVAAERMVWIDEQRIAVQRRGVLEVFALRRNRLRRLHGAATYAAALAYLYEEGLVLGGVPWPDDERFVAGVHVYDLATGTWRDTIAREPRVVVFSQDQPESANLYDVQARQELAIEDVESDRPDVAAWSRDGQFIWIGDNEGGPIVGTGDGETYVDTASLRARRGDVPVLGRDGVIARGGRRKPSDRAAAIALLPDRRWRVIAGDGAFEGVGHHFAFGFSPRAAAFDATGERVAVLLPDALWILAWDRPRLLARLPFP